MAWPLQATDSGCAHHCTLAIPPAELFSPLAGDFVELVYKIRTKSKVEELFQIFEGLMAAVHPEAFPSRAQLLQGWCDSQELQDELKPAFLTRECTVWKEGSRFRVTIWPLKKKTKMLELPGTAVRALFPEDPFPQDRKVVIDFGLWGKSKKSDMALRWRRQDGGGWVELRDPGVRTCIWDFFLDLRKKHREEGQMWNDEEMIDLEVGEIETRSEPHRLLSCSAPDSHRVVLPVCRVP